MVVVALIPNRDSDCFQVAEVNCAPRSEVPVAGTPKRAIHVDMNALAVVSAFMSGNGATSAQRFVRSIMVSRYWNPLRRGRGPTRSTWTCWNLDFGTGIGETGALVCRETLNRWHASHERAHLLTSAAILGHTYERDMSDSVVLPDGWDKLWTARKMRSHQVRGTRILGCEVDTSHVSRAWTPGNVSCHRMSEGDSSRS